MDTLETAFTAFLGTACSNACDEVEDLSVTGCDYTLPVVAPPAP